MEKTRREKLRSLKGPRKSGRFKGVSVGRDSQGIYIYTHRARSKSYSKQTDIPDSVIRRIKSTG